MKEKGFSLIELMIVVAIIGILASIAVPSYLRMQVKSKTAEATMNIGGIANTEITWLAEHDYYLEVDPAPGSSPIAKRRPWLVKPAVSRSVVDVTHKGTFENLGYRAKDAVRYNYAVSVGPNATGIPAGEATIDAAADLDGDGSAGTFAFALARRTPVLAGKQSGGKKPKGTSIIENLFPNTY